MRPTLPFDRSGTGPAVVLVHAFPQSRAMWAGVAAELADSFTVITPDLWGFGDAPPVDGWTVDDAADALAELLDRAGVARAVVGGCSMGGYVALAFVRRHPDRLAGLILANTRADADSPDTRAGRAESIRLVEKRGTAALVDKMLPRLVGATTRRDRPDVVAAVRGRGAAQPADGVVAGLKALRDRTDSTPDLANITVPTLVIAGAEDELIPPAVSRAMADAIPGAEFVTLPGCGHLSPVESPAAFAAAVREFLGRSPAR